MTNRIREDFAVFERAKCTRDEKREVVNLIQLMVSMSEKARREGLLALEDELPSLSDPSVSEGLQMIVDGSDPDLVGSIISTRIRALELKGKELLKGLVTLSALEFIQNGANPNFVRQGLTAYLGNDIDLLPTPKAEAPSEEIPALLEQIDKLLPASDLTAADHSTIMHAIAADHQLNKEQRYFLNAGELPENFFQTMSPDNIAVMLMYMEEPARTRYFGAMAPETQVAILQAISLLPTVDLAYFLEQAKEALKKLTYAIESGFKPIGGINAAAELVRNIGKASGLIFYLLEEQDSAFATEIRYRLFSFEDLNLLDDLAVQKVLRELDNQDLAKALKAASPPLKQKVLKNMSKRAAELLREDMAFMGQILVKDAKESQQKIVNIIRKLDEDGEIIVPRPADGPMTE